MFFEPALFGVTGAAVKINELDEHVVSVGVGILIITGVIRILVTGIIAFGDNLNLKEKVLYTKAEKKIRNAFYLIVINLLYVFFFVCRYFVHWLVWQKRRFKPP